MVVNAVTCDRMGAASRFSNDGGTFQILEVIAELLGTGEVCLWVCT